jgi:hypothetical protein
VPATKAYLADEIGEMNTFFSREIRQPTSTTVPYTFHQSPAALHGSGRCVTNRIIAMIACETISRTGRTHTRSSGPVHETRPLATRSLIRGRAFKGMAAVGEVSLAADTCRCLAVDTSTYGTGARLSGGMREAPSTSSLAH